MTRSRYVTGLVALLACLLLLAGCGTKHTLRFYTPGPDGLGSSGPAESTRLTGGPAVLHIRKGELTTYGLGTLPDTQLVVAIENVGEEVMVVDLDSVGLANFLYRKIGKPSLSRIRPPDNSPAGSIQLGRGGTHTMHFSDIGPPPLFVVVRYGFGGKFFTDVVRVDKTIDHH